MKCVNLYREWHKSAHIFHIVLCCILLLMLPFFLWWMDRRALGLATGAYMGWRTVATNTLPIYILTALSAGLSGRVLWSLSFVTSLVAALYAVCKIKMQVLQQPILLQDFYFIKTMNAASLRLFSSYVDASMTMRVVAAIALLLIVIVGFVLEGKVRILRKKWRISALLFGLVGWLVIYFSLWPVNAIYTTGLVQTDRVFSYKGALRGLVSNLVYQNVKISEFDFTVDNKAISDGLDMLQHATLWPYPSRQERRVTTDKEATLPDIIVLLSESFIDPHIISGMQEYPDIIPNFRRLAEQSCSGYFLPPTYGGGTVRTEFEVLTGMPMDAFPGVQFPYNELPFKSPVAGLGSFLHARGYRSFAIHGNSGFFWNRINILRAMGIDEFKDDTYFSQQKKARDGIWFSDESMTDILLEQLSIEVDKPSFAVVISMQGHGPYVGGNAKNSLQEPELYQSLELPLLHDQMADEELRVYLYHIAQADRQLGRLAAALEERNRPYRLLFFGDHLAGLKHAWSRLEFSDRGKILEQKTPWLIAGCHDHDNFHARIHTAWQLPSALLESAGIIDSYGYFAFSSGIGVMAWGSEGRGMTHALNNALHSAARANFNADWKDHVQK